MPFPSFIDNTIRKAIATCPTKAKYEFIENLRPTGAKAIHLHFGAAFAVGLESARRAFFERGASADAAVDSAVRDAVHVYGDADAEGTFKTADRLEGALHYYFKQWPLDSELIVPVEGGIECSFEIPLPILHPDTGKNIPYVGRYDMLGLDKRGTLWVVDEKTASKLGELWDAKWDLDCQLTGYMWSVREQIRRGDRALPPASVSDIRSMVRAVSVLSKGYGHTEVPMVRSVWYIDRWYNQLIRDVERFKEAYTKGTFDLALHENACVQFGRRCDFNPLCLTPHPNRIKDSLYHVVHWNPLARGSD